MQLGFVIDHSRCIGCHACTVACKSENDVPLGAFRTWVKYVEEGAFPQVKRSFAVLRCNQCTAAPCVTICPVRALDKRSDGIVDVDPNLCIGCKSCMQACPYDALYINEAKGTAEKCHFCAHRTERGLAPACAVVCPTEAIIPGDFHDPESAVSKLKAAGGLRARKTEAGTGPNVHYREASPAGIDPSLTNASGGYLWANRAPGADLEAEVFDQLEAKARARTVYDVDHAPLWGRKVSAYLFTKSVAAGVFLVALLLRGASVFETPGSLRAPIVVALMALVATGALLVGDLKRPERFLKILLHPNWSSWLVRGAVILGLYGAALVGLGAAAFLRVDLPPPLLGTLLGITAVLAALAAAYTGWLFGQAKGRVLWMRRGLALDLLLHAVLAGAATWAVYPLLHAWLRGGTGAIGPDRIRIVLGASLVLHAVSIALEKRRAPAGRAAEYHRAARLLTAGPFAARRHGLVLASGIAVPLALLAFGTSPAVLAAAGLLALVGLATEQDLFVRAGQALPIS